MRRKAGAAKTSSEVCCAIAVRKASRQMTQLYDDALEPSGLKSTQFAILHEIATRASAPPTMGQLAEALVMDRSALGHNLRPLARDERIALGEAMASIAERPAVRGGCPLLNTAVESDDAKGPEYAELRKRTRAGMRRTIGYARTIIEQGIESGELIPTLDAGAEVEMMIATMEGSLMLAKLFDDSRYVLQASAHFAVHASRMVRAPAPASWGVRVGPPLAAAALLAELSAG